MVGFPHSEILGSKLIRSSPRLIAAYYVLHRLCTPRHPLNALKTLDRSHYQCPQHQHAPPASYFQEPAPSSGLCLSDALLHRFDRSDQNKPKSRADPVPPRGCRVKRNRKCISIRCPKIGSSAPKRITNEQTLSLTKRRKNRWLAYARAPKRSKGWWSQTGSNRRHPACKAGALPAELWPHLWPHGSYRTSHDAAKAAAMTDADPPAGRQTLAEVLAALVRLPRQTFQGEEWLSHFAKRQNGGPG